MKGVILGLVLLITGCASLGLAPPQNPQQGIAYAYSGVTAGLNTLTSMLQTGVISSADAVQVNSALLTVKSSLDLANGVALSSGPVAINVLTAATASLAKISAYLACRQQRATSCQL